MGCKSHCGGWDWHGPHRGHFKGNTLVHGLQCVGRTFTREQEIAGYVSQCTPFIAILVLLDSMEDMFSGEARGCGWQASAAAANLGAFYIVSLPAAIALAFVYNLKVIGLCIGLVLGIIFQVAILGILTDWQKQA